MWGKASLAILCAAAGLALAAHYPLGAAPAVAAFVACAAVAALRPGLWLLPLPAVALLAGLAPWTGWITFEELDMLALAIAAGGYLRLAWRRAPVEPVQAVVSRPSSAAPAVLLLAVVFAASLAVSAARGVADAGGFEFGWFQGYLGPMNSLRLVKSFFLALLLAPLWRDAERAAPARAAARLTAGLALGLAVASLAALWERLAFTGLLDFSADYRTTSLFWEMHVGGAAFDGFLALTVPFALRGLLSARTASRSLLATAVLALASYACLTTFSRGVFVAIPAGVVVTLALAVRQHPRDPRTARQAAAGGWPAVGLALAFAAAAAWMFPTSGYRGLLGLLGGCALLLRLGGRAGREGRRGGPHWLPAIAAGGAISALIVLAAGAWPKGAYVAYAAALAFALAVTAWRPGTAWLRLGAAFGVLAGLGAVAAHWGGDAALRRAAPAMAAGAVAAAALVGRGRAAWSGEFRWQGAVLVGLAATGGLVGVMAGGAYMTARLSTSGEDLAGRIAHWREGIGMLRTPAEWAFGMGLGRYPAHHQIEHSATDTPGDYALRGTPAQPWLALAGGRHVIGWGEMLRVSQRISTPQPPVIVSAGVRATQRAGLHFEVCERHLLYTGNCLARDVIVDPTAGAWLDVQARLDGDAVSRGAWYAPKLIVFSVADVTRGTEIDVRGLSLRGADGDERLVNGDLSRGLARWFFSSDRNHLPWHLKNLFVHTLFEQGALGLVALVGLVAGALWRVALGGARAHPLAPAIGGAIVGFVAVGAFDSLLDVPRDAFFFYGLLGLGLCLHGVPSRVAVAAARPTPPPLAPSLHGVMARADAGHD